jgi:dTDP-4-amino-4,6-dideoxygalactose transaminase
MILQEIENARLEAAVADRLHVVAALDVEGLGVRHQVRQFPRRLSFALEGLDPAEYDEEFAWAYGVGEKGWRKLRQFVRQGGTLLAVGDSVATADALVVFGITGDLGHRMIMPSLYRLELRGALPCDVIGVGTHERTSDQLRGMARGSIERAASSTDEEAFRRFAKRISYIAADAADPFGGNLDPAASAARITHRTRAIVATHMWGTPASIEELRRLADERDLMLFEDGSHAHGAIVEGRKVGSFGHGAAFSMNGPKPLSAGECGFLLTSNPEIYQRALLHGQYNKRCRSEIPDDAPLYRFAVTGMGLKHRIHPLAAAIGRQQLDRLDDYLAGRQRIAVHIREQMRDVPGIHVVEPSAGATSSWYGLILQYRADELDGLPIERYYAALQAEGCIEADRPGSTCPLNLLPLFQEPGPLFPRLAGRFAYAPGQFPAAETFHDNVIKLPVWHRDEDQPLVDAYIDAIRKVSDRYTDLLTTGVQHA